MTIQEKAKRYTPKPDVYYLVAFSKDTSDKIAEGHLSFCGECKSKVLKYFNEKLKNKEYDDIDLNFDDISEYEDIKELKMWEEYSSECGDFLHCANCGETLDTGYIDLMYDFEYWLNNSISVNVENLSERDCYEIVQLLKYGKNENLVQELKEKIKLQNKKL